MLNSPSARRQLLVSLPLLLAAISVGVLPPASANADGRVIAFGSMPPSGLDGSTGTAAEGSTGLRDRGPIQAESGAVICWGENDDGQSTPPSDVTSEGGASQVGSGSAHSCALQLGSGRVFCWGDDSEGQSSPPDSVNGPTPWGDW